MSLNIDKKNIQKWCDALRSGKYKQSKGRLQDENGFCCLGVACDLFIADENIEKDINGYMVGARPCEQSYSAEWLANINDNYDLTFDEIADCLEAVYIHEVLN